MRDTRKKKKKQASPPPPSDNKFSAGIAVMINQPRR